MCAQINEQVKEFQMIPQILKIKYVNTFKDFRSQTHIIIEKKKKNIVKYLDISLSIKKMWELFNNNENNIQVSYIKYYRTFHTKFDLKFQQCQIDI